MADVRKIALNLDLPASTKPSSNKNPCLRLLLNLPINTRPSLTIIPIKAITPNNERILTGNPCIQWPQATPTRLTGISKNNNTGWEKLLNVKAIVIYINIKIGIPAEERELINLNASLFWPSKDALTEGYLACISGIIFVLISFITSVPEVSSEFFISADTWISLLPSKWFINTSPLLIL